MDREKTVEEQKNNFIEPIATFTFAFILKQIIGATIAFFTWQTWLLLWNKVANKFKKSDSKVDTTKED